MLVRVFCCFTSKIFLSRIAWSLFCVFFVSTLHPPPCLNFSFVDGLVRNISQGDLPVSDLLSDIDAIEDIRKGSTFFLLPAVYMLALDLFPIPSIILYLVNMWGLFLSLFQKFDLWYRCGKGIWTFRKRSKSADRSSIPSRSLCIFETGDGLSWVTLCASEKSSLCSIGRARMYSITVANRFHPQGNVRWNASPRVEKVGTYILYDE